jgi:molybdate transport system regulatory protein
MTQPKIRFRIDFTSNAQVGPGKIELLEAIRASGSLSQAARELGMSYRRAWLLIDSLKSTFNEPVASATTGGPGGGGATLTPFGEQLIDSYRALERDIASLATRRLHRLTTALAKPEAAKPKSTAAAGRRSLTPRAKRR